MVDDSDKPKKESLPEVPLDAQRFEAMLDLAGKHLMLKDQRDGDRVHTTEGFEVAPDGSIVNIDANPTKGSEEKRID